MMGYGEDSIQRRSHPFKVSLEIEAGNVVSDLLPALKCEGSPQAELRLVSSGTVRVPSKTGVTNNYKYFWYIYDIDT
jgi:hypothetical protein